MEKCEEFYCGKVKLVYQIDDVDCFILLFCNDIFVFDGKCIEQFDCKGVVNNKFNVFIMQKLEVVGILIQFDKLLLDIECLVKKFDMILVECVVCNFVVGSLVCCFGVEEGIVLILFIFELFLKNDVLGDLFINEFYVQVFGWVIFE